MSCNGPIRTGQRSHRAVRGARNADAGKNPERLGAGRTWGVRTGRWDGRVFCGAHVHRRTVRVRYTPQAKCDLAEIFPYIAQDNPAAARRDLAAIRRDIMLVSDNPGIGRPGRVAGTRELVISQLPYIAAYRQQSAGIDVLAVFHTARDWPQSL